MTSLSFEKKKKKNLNKEPAFSRWKDEPLLMSQHPHLTFQHESLIIILYKNVQIDLFCASGTCMSGFFFVAVCYECNMSPLHSLANFLPENCWKRNIGTGDAREEKKHSVMSSFCKLSTPCHHLVTICPPSVLYEPLLAKAVHISHLSILFYTSHSFQFEHKNLSS